MKITKHIEHIGNLIIYTLSKDGVKDYLTHNETLYKILSMDKLKPFRDNGRLRFKVRENGVDVNFYLHDLAIACYANMITNTDIFLTELQKYFEYKTHNGYSVDHADSNIYNNTITNLSLMKRELNSSKSGICAQFLSPYYLNTAYDDEHYRVQAIFDISQEYIQEQFAKYTLNFSKLTGGRAMMCFICETAEDFVACLKHLVNMRYEWCKPKETPKSYWQKNKTTNYWAVDCIRSITAQNKLLTMDKKDFMLFKNGTIITHY